MALHIIRYVKGVQAVNTDQQDVFDVAVGSGLSNSRKKYNCNGKCGEQTTIDHLGYSSLSE
jgi:hypothetical protein